MTLEGPLKNENEVNFIIFNLSVPDFSYLISKSFCDVISDTWFSCPYTGTVVLNGLNKCTHSQNFIISEKNKPTILDTQQFTNKQELYKKNIREIFKKIQKKFLKFSKKKSKFFQ